jgi:hypothetical protein
MIIGIWVQANSSVDGLTSTERHLLRAARDGVAGGGWRVALNSFRPECLFCAFQRTRN